MKKAEITCLFVTHDIEDEMSIADKTIEIVNGKIISNGVQKKHLEATILQNKQKFNLDL